MRKILILTIIWFIASSPANSQNEYYWYKNKKITLSSDSSIFYLQFRGSILSPQLIKSEIASILQINESEIHQLSSNEFTLHRATKIDPNKISVEIGDLKYAAPLLKKDTSTMVVLSTIVVELKEGHSINEILNLFPKRFTVKKNRGYNTFVLESNSKSFKDVLDVSNFLFEQSGLVNWSEPEFFSNYKPFDDPLYPDQYYLHNIGQYGGAAGIDINIEPAWLITKGCNTRVAVIDEGVEDHEDFAGRVLLGFTAGTINGTGAPQNGVKGHGVACAGIIAATHNDIGIKGIAPNALILPINIFPNTPDPLTNPSGAATSDQIAEAIDWAWNQGAADLLSNSWGGGAQSNNIDAAINRARTQGRGANGCPVVFASGNDNPYHDVDYPANLDGVITVGACNNAAPSGDIWYYSDRGASMDLVAPSGDVNLAGDVTTTDRMNANGYEVGNYTQRFGGTSAACPQVSGIIALMLSVNPNLTEAQVRNILQTTATDMGTSGFDNTFGFGRANAGAAVNQALSMIFNITGDNYVCNTSNNYSVTNLPVGATIQWQAPQDIVTINSPNSLQTTLTKNNTGIISLSAIISNTCSGGQITVTKPNITVGAPNAYTLTPSYSTYGYSNWLHDNNCLKTYNFPGMYSGDFSLSDQVAISFAWTYVSKYPSTATVNISYSDPRYGTVTVKPQGAYVIYRLTTSNSCGSYSHDYKFTADGTCDYGMVERTIRTNDLQKQGLNIEELSVTPNPANSSFTFGLPTEYMGGTLKIITMHGQMVKKAIITDNIMTVDVQSFTAGVYLAEITSTSGKKEKKKIVVVH